MARARTPRVFIVSDGRGDTAAQVLKAAAVQFEGRAYRVTRRSGVRTEKDVVRVVQEAAKAHAVVFYTLVEEETRRAMRRATGRRLVPTVDILGPCFTALAERFQGARRGTPGLLYALDRDRIDRMEAIDFTLHHDDGLRSHELSKADVVLVGVSRASKSSTCFYLAYAGVRAANVPLIPGIEPPAKLLALDPSRVVGLRVNVDRLLTVRESRASHLGGARLDGYLDRRELAREVLWANTLMEERGWSSIDASYLAVEEIAREVMRLAGLRGDRRW
ncbi:MAG TPA: pyruvate, water dikinase regulatory protein [Candidatus Polarisedimenticolaceae bacterium]